MLPTQTQSHLQTPITKLGLSYGKNVIATIKYHGIHIRAKDFDGGLSILTGKGPNKKLRNNTLATTEPQSHLPTPITMQGLSNGKNVIATIKYHWIHIQS
jgi:molybdopterin-binding protein